MQLNTLSALALLSGYLTLGAQAWSGYTATCNSESLTSPDPNSGNAWRLYGNCRTPSGTYLVSVSRRLGDCLGNSGGNLVYLPG